MNANAINLLYLTRPLTISYHEYFQRKDKTYSHKHEWVARRANVKKFKQRRLQSSELKWRKNQQQCELAGKLTLAPLDRKIRVTVTRQRSKPQMNEYV